MDHEIQVRDENQLFIRELVDQRITSLNTSIRILINAMNKISKTEATGLIRETIPPPTLEPKDGNTYIFEWLEWDAWEPCTMTCAFGSQMRKRECSYENFCNGSSSEFRSCSFTACETSVNVTDQI